MPGFSILNLTHNYEPSLAPEGPRIVATGEAQRNPWTTSKRRQFAPEGRRILSESRGRNRRKIAHIVEALRRPSGAWDISCDPDPRVARCFTRGNSPSPLRGVCASRFLLRPKPQGRQSPTPTRTRDAAHLWVRMRFENPGNARLPSGQGWRLFESCGTGLQPVTSTGWKPVPHAGHGGPPHFGMWNRFVTCDQHRLETGATPPVVHVAPVLVSWPHGRDHCQ